MTLDDHVRKNKPVFFTISDADYAVMALTMFDSVRKFYPDSDLFLFVFGTGSARCLDNGVNVVYIGELLDELDLSQRLAHYLQVELATSVRPQCFEFLFSKNYERIIYLDPDIYVFRRMTEVDDLLDGEVNGVLTPHALRPLQKDFVVEGDNIFLQCGIYNMGFLALKNTSDTMRMLSWWKEKLKWQCIVDFPKGYFVDQKWLDFLPAYFDTFHVLRLPTYNLAPWNVEHYNVLSDSLDNFYVDDFDHPVAFIHFSGIKRSEHHFIGLEEAREFYLEQLQKTKFMKLGFVNYDVRFKPTNLFLDKVCTFLYKDYIKKTKDIGSNPLSDDGFYNFLHSVDRETNLPVYIRKLFDILPDIFVGGYLPTRRPIDYDNLIAWVKASFPYDGVVSLETMVQLRNGSINNGYKERYAEASKAITLPGKSSTTNGKPSYYPSIVSFTSSKQRNAANGTTSASEQVILKVDRIEIIDRDFRVCIPFTDESGTLKKDFDTTTKYTEMWVPSARCEKKFRSSYGFSNLTVIPYPVLKPKYKVQEICLPIDKFTVLMRHDFDRDFAAQNPLASLRAFLEAFGQRDDVLLVCFLTSIRKLKDYETIISEFGDKKNVKIVEDAKADGLYYSYLHYAHCLISLHNDATFGYDLAEAMSLGKYVVATSNGGNAEYMNSENSFLIEASPSQSYATTAAQVLNSIYDDTDVMNAQSKKAKLTIQKHFSPATVGLIMQKRLEALRAANSTGKNKTSLRLRTLRKIYAFSKPHLKKIPICVRVYVKLNKIRTAYLLANQASNVTTILLKNVNRPAVLE